VRLSACSQLAFSKAVIPAKTVGATNRVEGHQCKQAIKRLMLRLGEQHRCAQRTLLTKPKESRKPAEPAHTRRGLRLLRFQHLLLEFRFSVVTCRLKFHPIDTAPDTVLRYAGGHPDSGQNSSLRGIGAVRPGMGRNRQQGIRPHSQCGRAIHTCPWNRY
jgi:hypothetical protein